MDSQNENSKRIAKNTLFLYARSFFVLIVSLFTSRINLLALGIDDYGVFNVVAGFVGLFGIVTGAVSAAISRYLTYELGRNDMNKLKEVFSTSFISLIFLSFFFFFISETLGLWFVNSQLNLPYERLFAANIVYQLSIISTIVAILSIPYNALIIAHEKISVFANISILEILGKVALSVILLYTSFDRLILFGVFLAFLSLLMRGVYAFYCKKNFEECCFRLAFNKQLINQMTTFAGWNMVGAASGVLSSQGVNIVINIFCGVALNAARGISGQVETGIKQFMTNFITALEPQIIKSYSSGNYEYTTKLIQKGTKFSFFLVQLFAIPVFFDAEYLLSLWLKTVPDYTIPFLRLSLISILVESYSSTLMIAIVAHGDIKVYQIIVGGVLLLNFPFSYLLLYFGYNVISVYILAILITFLGFLVRLIVLRWKMNLMISPFVKTMFQTIIILIISSISSLFITLYYEPCIIRTVFICLASLSSSLFFIYFLGIGNTERTIIKNKLSHIYEKKHF